MNVKQLRCSEGIFHFSHFHNQLIDYQADSDGEKDKPFRMHLIALMGLTGECFSTAH